MVGQQRSRSGGTAPRVVAVTLLVVVGMIAPVIGLGGPMTVSAQTNGTSGNVTGSAELDVSAPENRFDPGEEGTLDLFVSNDGEVRDDGETHPAEAIDRATEARSVDVEVSRQAFAPIEVRTDQQSLGTIASGDTSGAPRSISRSTRTPTREPTNSTSRSSTRTPLRSPTSATRRASSSSVSRPPDRRPEDSPSKSTSTARPGSR